MSPRMRLQSARSALYDRVRSITRKPAEWVGQSVSNITHTR